MKRDWLLQRMLERGLYVDLQPWSYHVFDLEVSQ
jgi:hypothetical protein